MPCNWSGITIPAMLQVLRQARQVSCNDCSGEAFSVLACQRIRISISWSISGQKCLHRHLIGNKVDRRAKGWHSLGAGCLLRAVKHTWAYLGESHGKGTDKCGKSTD
jgi:hypothetical protein